MTKSLMPLQSFIITFFTCHSSHSINNFTIQHVNVVLDSSTTEHHHRPFYDSGLSFSKTNMISHFL
ncbi:hypothetical protein HanRHA438_Chr10g0457381 [Helianthus annuus]|nr:hypothetical protein HanIR_Chr10g0479701 [Helianthus annuus]KAJ0879949.1 hypothetical protein HanRHA438_Chr10g0457381 [Helianthus annuus]